MFSYVYHLTLPPPLSASRENQPGTRTMLLMTLRFTYLASLCAHIVAGVWFSVACYSVQSDAAYQLGAICKPNTWSVDSTTKHGEKTVFMCG